MLDPTSLLSPPEEPDAGASRVGAVIALALLWWRMKRAEEDIKYLTRRVDGITEDGNE